MRAARSCDRVRQSYNHPTADEIYNVVRAQDDKISRGTVYRNLNLLADAGEILSIKTLWRTASRTSFRCLVFLLCTAMRLASFLSTVVGK